MSMQGGTRVSQTRVATLATIYSYACKDIVCLSNQICNNINTIRCSNHTRNRAHIRSPTPIAYFSSMSHYSYQCFAKLSELSPDNSIEYWILPGA